MNVFTLCNGPCNSASYDPQSQLNAMKLNRLHAATMAPSPKTREEKGETRPHQRARRASSDDNSCPKSAIPENRITTIPELTESFEKKLYLRDKRTMSLVSNSNAKLLELSILSVPAQSVIDYPEKCRFDNVLRLLVMLEEL